MCLHVGMGLSQSVVPNGLLEILNLKSDGRGGSLQL